MKRAFQTITLHPATLALSGNGRPTFGVRPRAWLAGLFAAAICLFCGTGRAAPAICAISPSSEASGNCSGSYILQITGTGFSTIPNNNTVYWDGTAVGTVTSVTLGGSCSGSSSNTLAAYILTVSLPCSLISTALEFEAYPVKVRVGGQDSNPLSFTVYDPSSTALFVTTDVPAGETGYAQTVVGSTGQGGVVATFDNQGGDPAAMTVANYVPNLLPTGLLFLPGDQVNTSQLYDVQVKGGTSLSGKLSVDFYYQNSVTHPAEMDPDFKLQYYDASIPTWVTVTGDSTSGYPSVKQPYVNFNDQDNLAGPCCLSGGVFSVVFDDTHSIPSLSDLSGTIFTMAPTPLPATPATLWPPNHKMKTVTVNAPAGGSIISVTSSEPETGLGNGDIGPDSEIILPPLTVKLRAERGGAQGRIYTILVQLVDGSQNIAVVRVPRDNGGN